MTKLKWTRSWTFLDNRRQFQATGQGVYDVPDDAVEDYLERSDGWEQPDGGADSAPDDESAEEDADAAEAGVDGEDETADDSTEDEAESDDATDEDLQSIVDQHVPELEEDLETGQYDDDLDRLEALEEADQDRTTALTAIRSRKDEISEE